MTEISDKQEVKLSSRYHVKWQLFICLAMLILALVGLMVIDFYPRHYWTYSRIMAVSYVILSIALFLVTHRENIVYTFWHQLLHWLGLILAIFVVTVYVKTGVISPIQAGLVTMVLLALAIFLAGIYISPFLVLLGVILGVISVIAAYVQAYLFVFLIPLVVIAVGLFFLLAHYQKKKVSKKVNDNEEIP